MITYLVPTIQEGEKSVGVTFVNDNGEQFTRSINVPRNTDGTVNEVLWAQILEDQLNGVIYKAQIGLITFTSGSSE